MLRRLSGQVFAREALIFCEPTYEYNDIIGIVSWEFRLSESFYNLLLNFSIFIIGSLILLWIAIEMRRYGKDPLELAAKTLNCSKTVALVVLVCFTKLAHYGSTKGNRNYTTSQSQSSMVNSSAGESLTDGDTAISIFSVTNLCFSKIQINTNVVSLTAAWPINMFAEGVRLDFFAKVGALTNDKQWIGCNDISPAQTNCQHFVNLSDFTSGTNVPAAMFFSVSERSSTASTMNDSDADGIPDVYEFHNDTNPYIADADTMPRLTVGTNAQYATIEAAVSASTNYSVIALSAETFNLNQPLVLPAHPVLLEGSENGYAILRSSASPGVVMLTDGQGVETMLRNVIVDLRATDGFQAGFWIDGDAVDDAQEIADGSNPYDFQNFRISLSIRVQTKDVVSSITNYIISSQIEDWVNMPYRAALVSGYTTVGINEVVTNRCVYVNCFRDFNKNGICDESDIVYKWKFIKSEDDVQKKCLEDCENDNIPDSLELAEGTNPMDYRSYCYSATALVSSIFSTTNMLKVVSMFGTNVVSEVQLVTNSVQAFDFAHRATGSRERHSLVFWDDVDDDNCIDETEYSSKIEVPVSGHTVSYRARLGYGEFDSDNNGLLDYWESATGLEEVTGPHSADEDTDGDGLVNLHKYWAGTDPLTPDGSNTAYSVLSRSIDERLASVANVDLALPVYSNYYENASNGVFVLCS